MEITLLDHDFASAFLLRDFNGNVSLFITKIGEYTAIRALPTSTPARLI